MSTHLSECRVVADPECGICNCAEFRTNPIPLTRKGVEKLLANMIDWHDCGDECNHNLTEILETDAALRRTIVDQAEEIEQQAHEMALMKRACECLHSMGANQAQTIARLEHELANGTTYMRAQYDSIVRMKDDLQRQLTVVTTERDTLKTWMDSIQWTADANLQAEVARLRVRVKELEEKWKPGTGGI